MTRTEARAREGDPLLSTAAKIRLYYETDKSWKSIDVEIPDTIQRRWLDAPKGRRKRDNAR